MKLNFEKFQKIALTAIKKIVLEVTDELDAEGEELDLLIINVNEQGFSIEHAANPDEEGSYGIEPDEGDHSEALIEAGLDDCDAANEAFHELMANLCESDQQLIGDIVVHPVQFAEFLRIAIAHGIGELNSASGSHPEIVLVNEWPDEWRESSAYTLENFKRERENPGAMLLTKEQSHAVHRLIDQIYTSPALKAFAKQFY